VKEKNVIPPTETTTFSFLQDVKVPL